MLRTKGCKNEKSNGNKYFDVVVYLNAKIVSFKPGMLLYLHTNIDDANRECTRALYLRITLDSTSPFLDIYTAKA